MTEFVLEHHPHPHHASAMATGLALHGPLGDGLIHLTFYRDGSRLVKEVFEAEEREIPGGKAFKIKDGVPNSEIKQFREDVATVLIPVEKFAGFATAIQQMAAQLKTLTDSQGE